MSWANVGTIAPGKEWLSLPNRLQSRLLRLSFFGDAAWLEKFQPRAYIRLRVGTEGRTKRWETIWPKDSEEELLLLTPIPIESNYLEVRKRRDPYSAGASYSIIFEEFQAEPYLITYPASQVTMDGDPMTMDGEPVVT